MAKNNNESIKSELHRRNRNRKRYDLDAMKAACPELAKFIQLNKAGNESIDFSHPSAVRSLNIAILKHYYDVDFWEFPKENLCPAIPGRADYIHYVADLLEKDTGILEQSERNITCCDIGTGASCIYPIIGVAEYDWNFITSDIDTNAIKSAQKIVNMNPSLNGKIAVRLQKDPRHIFNGVIRKNEKIDISICNPPFHSSKEEAVKSAGRKLKNLGKNKNTPLKLNFSGNKNELIYNGGELQFIQNMICESKDFSSQILWFTTLVSKEKNLPRIKKYLENSRPEEVQIINLATGNKKSRIIAWTYFNQEERKKWRTS